jgi:hypothetical protein
LGAELVIAGDVEGLRAALAADPGLATARPDGSRTLLHVLTDWPGHRPRALETFAVLVEAGADVNARFGGDGETPLMRGGAAGAGCRSALGVVLGRVDAGGRGAAVGA